MTLDTNIKNLPAGPRETAMPRTIPDYVGDHFATAPVSKTGCRPAIYCKDGTLYSVQASDGHYCSPNDNTGPWTAFEVWGRNKDGRSISTYPKGWVKKDTINGWIHRHGGAA
jgi:hypothetical protein